MGIHTQELIKNNKELYKRLISLKKGYDGKYYKNYSDWENTFPYKRIENEFPQTRNTASNFITTQIFIRKYNRKVTMKNLFIFGDSYSVSWEQSIQRSITHNVNPHKEYLDWLGNQPTHFSDIIKNKFNIDNVYNYSIGGSDNYQILESIGKHINRINKSDYVIIGWSGIHRFRFVEEHDGKIQWIRINTRKTTPTIELSKGDKDYLFRQVVNRDNDITLQEVINFNNFLKKSLLKILYFHHGNIHIRIFL